MINQGFYDLASEYNYNSFVPYIYQEGVYAIPETQDVKLLFYRKDIFKQIKHITARYMGRSDFCDSCFTKYDMNIFVPPW